MPVPRLTSQGVLPPGIHECTVGEVDAVFGHSNPNSHRGGLWRRFLAFVAWIKGMGVFSELYMGGSYVTSKHDPGDIDVAITLPPPSPGVLAKIDRRLFDESHTKSAFGVHVLVVVPQVSDWVAFLQFPRPEEVLARGITAGTLKGILKVIL